MKKCNKCKIKISTTSTTCPLCKSQITGKAISEFPKIKNIITNNLLRKILLLIVCIISISVAIINYILTPNIKWSLFVIIQLLFGFYIFYNILSGKRKTIKVLLFSSIFISLISIFWDIYTNLHGWSFNYVIPAICITYGLFLIILRIVNFLAFTKNTSYIYLNILLEFIPLILCYFKFANQNILIYLSAFFGFSNLLLLIIFDWAILKNDLIKKMHI